MKKAIFFTIDALFALVLAFVFLSFVYYSAPDISTSYRGDDALRVLHLSDSLLSESVAQEYIDASLAPFCGNLSVFASGGVLQYSIVSDGCGSPTDEIRISRRSFYDDGIYYAELRLW